MLAVVPEVVEAVRWWALNYAMDGEHDAVSARDVHQLLPGRHGIRTALSVATAYGWLREVKLHGEAHWVPGNAPPWTAPSPPR